MRCRGPVAASDIPVHREIYKEAAAYFDAYDPRHAAAVLKELLVPEGASRLAELRKAGDLVSAEYSAREVMPQWVNFFSRMEAIRSRATPVLAKAT
jgi:hypothetical protein